MNKNLIIQIMLVAVQLPSLVFAFSVRSNVVLAILILFIANSLSQILLEFYTKDNKKIFSVLCRLFPIAMAIVAYLNRTP